MDNIQSLLALMIVLIVAAAMIFSAHCNAWGDELRYQNAMMPSCTQFQLEHKSTPPCLQCAQHGFDVLRCRVVRTV